MMQYCCETARRVVDVTVRLDVPVYLYPMLYVLTYYSVYMRMSLCLHIRRVITQTYVMLHPLPPLGSDLRAPLSPPVRRV